MTITVEDGTGLPAANSFTSVSFADTFFADIGEATWAAAIEALKEEKLILATRYMSKRYGTRLKGIISSSTQGVEFPRDYIYDERGTLITGVPVKWQQACCWYARYAIDNDLIPPIIYPVANGAPVPFGKVARVMQKVGPVTEDTYYASPGGGVARVSTDSGNALIDSGKLVQYLEADLLVSPFLRSTKGVSR